VKDLQRNTQYIGGFSPSSSVVKWFWNLLDKGMNEDDQSKLLKFVTSCPRQPLMGFSSMQPPFTISKLDTDKANEKLPTAATCFNVLRIPNYSSEKIFREKLMYAIHANAGFELA
jgi:ubiquitin-protein ligase E3 C